MRYRRPLVLLSLVVVFIGLPELADRRLAARYARHDELIRRAECATFPCVADFDGNGRVDQLLVRLKYLDDGPDSRLTVAEGERELFSIHYEHVDHTFRTHAAIHQPSAAEAPRLLVYDGLSRTRVRAAFAWDGRTLSEVQATRAEREILDAMAARDDAGGWHMWVVWRLASESLLPAYQLFAAGALVLFDLCWLRRRRALRP